MRPDSVTPLITWLGAVPTPWLFSSLSVIFLITGTSWLSLALTFGQCLVAQSVKSSPAMQDPWVRKIAWRRKWQPTPVFLPGKSHGRRSLAGYSPWGQKELDMTEQASQGYSRRNLYANSWVFHSPSWMFCCPSCTSSIRLSQPKQHSLFFPCPKPTDLWAQLKPGSPTTPGPSDSHKSQYFQQ